MEFGLTQYIIGQVVTVLVAFGGVMLTSFLQNRTGSKKDKAEIKATSRNLIRDVIACAYNLALTAESYYTWIYQGIEACSIGTRVYEQTKDDFFNNHQTTRTLLSTSTLDARLFFQNSTISQHLDSIEQDRKALQVFGASHSPEQIMGIEPIDIEIYPAELNKIVQDLNEHALDLQKAAIERLSNKI